MGQILCIFVVDIYQMWAGFLALLQDACASTWMSVFTITPEFKILNLFSENNKILLQANLAPKL